MYYRVINIPKGNGQFRRIYAPDHETKRALRAKLPELNRLVAERCPDAWGFVPGRNATMMAMQHANMAWTLSCDLRSFFDRCSPAAIEDEVPEIDLDGMIIDGAPRQGLPTSPALANLSAAAMDRDIRAATERLDPRAIYTRYADDLTISSDSRAAVDALRAQLPAIVGQHGHECHPGKWSLQWAGAGRRVICGVAIDHGGTPHATRATRRRCRAATHHAERGDHGAAMHAAGLREWCRQRIPVSAELSARIGWRAVSPELAGALRLAGRGNRRDLRSVVGEFAGGAYAAAYRRLSSDCPDLPVPYLHACAAALATTFGKQWAAWLDGAAERGCSAHDACYWLSDRVTPSMGLGARLLRWRRDIQDLLSRGDDLRMVSAHWPSLTDAKRAMSWADTINYCRSLAYVGARHAGFAAECSARGVEPGEYPAMEGRWMSRLAKIDRETIPHVDERIGEYRIRTLDRDDPRGLWAGSHTSCCQHPGGAGEGCAWHGATDARGRIIVVEDSAGKIVAQSWLWRSGDVVVADNIEALANERMRSSLPDLYQRAATAMVGRLGVVSVHVGEGSSDCTLSQWPQTSPIAHPAVGYSDAKRQRKIQ